MRTSYLAAATGGFLIGTCILLSTHLILSAYAQILCEKKYSNHSNPHQTCRELIRRSTRNALKL